MNDPSPFCYTDKLGRTIDCSIDMLAAKRVDNSDFSEITDKVICLVKPEEALITQILSDRSLLCAVIYAIAMPQMAALIPVPPPEISGVEGFNLEEYRQHEFLRGFSGKTFDLAREALGEAFADFFPELETIIRSLKSQWAAAIVTIKEKVKAMSESTTPMFQDMLQRAFKPVEDAIARNDLKGLEDAVKSLGKHGEISTGDAGNAASALPTGG